MNKNSPLEHGELGRRDFGCTGLILHPAEKNDVSNPCSFDLDIELCQLQGQEASNRRYRTRSTRAKPLASHGKVSDTSFFNFAIYFSIFIADNLYFDPSCFVMHFTFSRSCRREKPRREKMSEEITLRISLPAALNYTVKLFFGFLDSKWENDELCSSASCSFSENLVLCT